MLSGNIEAEAIFKSSFYARKRNANVGESLRKNFCLFIKKMTHSKTYRTLIVHMPCRYWENGLPLEYQCISSIYVITNQSFNLSIYIYLYLSVYLSIIPLVFIISYIRWSLFSNVKPSSTLIIICLTNIQIRYIDRYIYIQGYPQRIRLQRRLYGVYIVCFLIFTTLCNFKQVLLPAKSWNKPI